jgi:hypothetical protein
MKIITLFAISLWLATPLWATTYYLSPTGNDSNTGRSSSAPWLTPNHSLNCGDTIIASVSNAYNYWQFDYTFGPVSCPAGNNVAWLKCATFDGCKIHVTVDSPYAMGMVVNNSYWGVQGWEVTASANSGECFQANPSGATTIHHIIFANDIANGCGEGGIGASPESATVGVDYFVVVGSIAYNSDQGSAYCNSGIDGYEAVASDTLPGTHYYFAGNFSYDNMDPKVCAGTPPTDGEGLFFDTWDTSQGSAVAYTQQSVIENNISVFNGGRGIEAFNNSSGVAQAPIYFAYNTVYGNETDPNQGSDPVCGEMSIYLVQNTQMYNNLTETTAGTGCGGNRKYNYYVYLGSSSDKTTGNRGYSASGYNTQTASSGGFSFGSNTFANPKFANPVKPSAPSCSGYANVPACMAKVIADFKPTASGTSGYGYQAVSTKNGNDPLFPQWLCSANLPSGLVTMSCKN